MTTLACLNGTILPADEARVPIWDRGFLFADAVYEVLRLYGGRPWLERAHYDRLRHSLAEARLAVDLDRLRARADETAAASEVDEGTVYIHVTRGVAPRAHVFPGPEVPTTELIVVRPYDDGQTARLRESGAGVISRPDLRWGRCDVKSTNLMANVMATEDAKQAGCVEAVLIDRDDFVTEATHSSLLWVRDGRLEGTPEGPEILPGTTRAFVLALARELGLTFGANRVTLDELAGADEVILTGTTIEVLPVVTLDGRPIGDGRPGPIATALGSAFRAAVEQFRAATPAFA